MRIALFALPTIALGLLAGCATPGPSPEQRPDDFALSVLVRPAQGDQDPMEAERWGRPAMYVIEPDGTLRAEFGPGVTGEHFPVIARRLDPEQADALYAQARASGILEPDAAGLVGSPLDSAGEPGSPEARICVIVDGHTRYLAIPLTGSPEQGGKPGASSVVDALAELTWQH